MWPTATYWGVTMLDNSGCNWPYCRFYMWWMK